MREEYKQIHKLSKENSDLKKQVLDLTIEIAELKDELNNHSCHAPTDGLEVGRPEDYDYEDCPPIQLNLFKD
jgi:predicted RNase H-like nuclease (RuvC/YqgF family)